jgi:hypothetical protein
MPSPLPRLAALTFTAVALTALAACGSSDPDTSTAAQDSPATAGQTDGTAGRGSGDEPTGTTIDAACPAETSITISTASGPVVLDATSAYADVTLDASATVTLGNYPITEQEASTVYQPTLTGAQAAVIFYVSATHGETLDLSTYTAVGSAPDSLRQLNNYAVYAPARTITSGFDLAPATVELTEISADRVCGLLTSPEATGRFIAPRI